MAIFIAIVIVALKNVIIVSPLPRLSYDRVFSLDVESKRRDAPKEDLGQWLIDMAIADANATTDQSWKLYRTRVVVEEETKTQMLFVRLIPE